MYKLQGAEHSESVHRHVLLAATPNTVVRCVQAANTSLKAALAQQEAHVKELTAGKPSSATEVSAGAASEQVAEHAQQVCCGLVSEPCAFSPHERCGVRLLLGAL